MAGSLDYEKNKTIKEAVKEQLAVYTVDTQEPDHWLKIGDTNLSSWAQGKQSQQRKTDKDRK